MKQWQHELFTLNQSLLQFLAVAWVLNWHNHALFWSNLDGEFVALARSSNKELFLSSYYPNFLAALLRIGNSTSKSSASLLWGSSNFALMWIKNCGKCSQLNISKGQLLKRTCTRASQIYIWAKFCGSVWKIKRNYLSARYFYCENDYLRLFHNGIETDDGAFNLWLSLALEIVHFCSGCDSLRKDLLIHLLLWKRPVDPTILLLHYPIDCGKHST